MAIDVENLVGRRAVNRWDRVAVGDLLERLTFSVPDHEAVVAGDGAHASPRTKRLTYREADRLVRRVANGLLARGLRRADRVMLLCENSVEAWVLKQGIARAGLVCAPVNPSLAPDALAHLLRLVEPKLTIVDAEVWPRVQGPLVAAGRAPAITVPLGGPVVEGSVSFEAFVDEASEDEVEVELHGDDIWQLLFTSGTTAMPKAVMLSHTNTVLAAHGFALSLTRGLRREHQLRLCSALPLVYHVGDHCFLFSVMTCGGTLILLRRPVPDVIASAIVAEKATALWGGSPALVGGVTEALARGGEATSLGVVVYGWGALQPRVLETLRTCCGEGLTTFGIFGQTEAIACHRFWPDLWRETYERTAPELNYVGVPSPLLASVVMDNEGRSLHGQPGVPGEAVYRSPVVMGGYYRDEAATREAFRHGWFHSGDSCVYDEAGLRVMVDRFKDIVKTGGENVSSLRVEAVLVQHPSVLRAAVVGLPHARWSEAVTAVVVPRPGLAPPSAEELIAFCRQRLAGFETPKAVIFTDALPETVGGKVLKYRLRAQHAAHYAAQPS